MRTPTVLALALIALGGWSLYLGLTGTWHVLSGIVLCPLSVLLAIPFWFWSRIARGHERAAQSVRELPERGLRVQGVVTDVLPLMGHEGRPVFSTGGAQMVLRVEVDRNGA